MNEALPQFEWVYRQFLQIHYRIQASLKLEMEMDELNLYEHILNLSLPWSVAHVELNQQTNRVDVYVDCDLDASLHCPKCNAPSPRYDVRKRKWRHLDTCQYVTQVHASIPRVKCDTHGVVQLEVPWAESHSRFTAMFEAQVIDWLREASINAVARRFSLSWNAIDGIMSRAVTRGLSRRRQSSVRHLAVDEVSNKKGHKYVTIISDEKGKVIDVLDDRTKESLASYYKSLSSEELSAIETISMDMSQAYISATKESVDDWKNKICFDRFHVMQDLNKAVNEVRKSELHNIPQPFREPLHKSRFSWLRSKATLKTKHKQQIKDLGSIAIKTSRAWSIRQYAGTIWGYKSRYWAKRAWDKWYGWAIRSRLQPIKTAAKSIKKNLWGIINAIIHKKNNAGAEGINSQIKVLKVRARGFSNKARFKVAILFNFGGLDLYPENIPT